MDQGYYTACISLTKVHVDVVARLRSWTNRQAAGYPHESDNDVTGHVILAAVGIKPSRPSESAWAGIDSNQNNVIINSL